MSDALAERTKWARLSSGGGQAGGVQGRSHSVDRSGISRIAVWFVFGKQ